MESISNPFGYYSYLRFILACSWLKSRNEGAEPVMNGITENESELQLKAGLGLFRRSVSAKNTYVRTTSHTYV